MCTWAGTRDTPDTCRRPWCSSTARAAVPAASNTSHQHRALWLLGCQTSLGFLHFSKFWWALLSNFHIAWLLLCSHEWVHLLTSAVGKECNLKWEPFWFVSMCIWYKQYYTYLIGQSNEIGLRWSNFARNKVDGGNMPFVTCLITTIPEFFPESE